MRTEQEEEEEEKSYLPPRIFLFVYTHTHVVVDAPFSASFVKTFFFLSLQSQWRGFLFVECAFNAPESADINQLERSDVGLGQKEEEEGDEKNVLSNGRALEQEGGGECFFKRTL